MDKANTVSCRNRSPVAHRRVGFGDVTECDTADSLLDRPLESSEFCSILLEPLGPARVRLRAMPRQLIDLKDCIANERDLINGKEISLAEALKTNTLSRIGKFVLAHMLAKSVWQYYESNWMHSRWTVNTIGYIPQVPPSNQTYQRGLALWYDLLCPFISMSGRATKS